VCAKLETVKGFAGRFKPVIGLYDSIIQTAKSEDKILDEKTLQGAIDQAQKTGHSLISILKSENLLNEDQLTKVVATTNNIEFVNLSPDMVDPMVAHLVSYEMSNQHNVIPVKKEGNNLIVAMSSPLNLSVRDQIEMKTGYRIIPVAATPSAIRQAIHYHFNVKNVTKQAVVSMRLKEGSVKKSQDKPRGIEKNIIPQKTGTNPPAN